MDTLITFDEAEGFLKNSPVLAARPDFYKLCALRQYIPQALKQPVCLQKLIHGWSVLAMDPNVYALLKPQPFVALVNLGATPVYPQFAKPATIKMTDSIFEWD
jgi:hypothetical protein